MMLLLCKTRSAPKETLFKSVKKSVENKRQTYMDMNTRWMKEQRWSTTERS
jgi:hypothetical protein